MSRLLASRRRVFFAALGLLLVLDVGRSILGRLGYAHPTATWQPDPAVYADLTWPPGADLAADVPLGRRVYAQRCAVCHGPDGRGNGPAAPSLIPRPRDFTLGQFKYKSTAAGQPPTEADLMHVVATGLPASAMPYWRDILDSVETRAVVAYVKSMSRGFERPAPAPLAVPPRAAPTAASIPLVTALLTTKGFSACHRSDGRVTLGQQADRVQRGEYLVHAEMCGLCHTAIIRTGIYRADDFYLAGGMRVGIYPRGMYVSRNLTSDRATGLGMWTEEQIANAIRNGRSPKRVLSPHAMPWIFLHALTQDDALAIASYLKTLPPVRNEVPAPLHYGVVETIVAKVVAGLPAAGPTLLSYADGNFGQTTTGPPRDLGQRILVDAQWLTLLLGAVLFFFAGPPERRLPHGARGWLKLVGVVGGIILLGVFGGVLYATPTLRIIPPEQIAGGIDRTIPQLNPARFGSPERAALAARGRYVFSVASCAMCHGSDGSGGLKISWKPFGTLWVRNITPDSGSGIGAWSDAEIARAIRAGVSHDGRALHWQGMIWDHASNWDEEDIRAVMVYLRTIPPVRPAVPAPRPPAPDDCVIYGFWVRPSAVPGCR